MYFNKRIFDELGLDYPYNLVLNDNWTFDAFSKLVKQGTKDLNGDGLIKAEDEKFEINTVDGKDFLVNKSGKIQKAGTHKDSANDKVYTVVGNNTDGYEISVAYED